MSEPAARAMRAAHPLDPLMRPRSIAIIGASPRGNRGTVILRNIRAMGFDGALCCINPKYSEIDGAPCLPSLSALAAPPDFVAIALPAEAAVAALRDAAGRGVGAGLVIAGGFAEGSGTGRELQAEVAAIGAATGMKVCGPNCYGLVHVHGRVAPYSGAIVEPLIPGNVAYVLQSGAISHALHDTLVGRGPGVSAIVTSGNEAVVELSEYVDWLLDDPGTDVVAVFIEGLRNPNRFAAVAAKALRLGKPIIALKVGRSPEGQRATVAHTGSVAGADAAYEGLFRKWGVIRAEDLDDMRETIVLLSSARRPRGPGVAMASISGGVTTLLTDLASAHGLATPAPSTATRARLEAALPEFGVAGNPMDTTGALYERPGILPMIAGAFLDDPNVNAFALALNTPLATPAHRLRARLLAELQQRVDKPLVCFAAAAGPPDVEMIGSLREAGVPFLMGARHTVLALRRWSWFGERREAMAAGRGRLASGAGRSHAPPSGERILGERAATALLSEYGAPFVEQARARDGAAAAAAAERLGFPVALKIDSPDIAHKTEAGGVALGLRDAGEVQRAFEAIVASAARHAPAARIDGVLVQRMAPKGLEALIGIARLGAFGLQLTLGLGGTLVEVWKDAAARPVPVTRRDVEEMIDDTMLGRLLDGIRGGPPFDRDALIDTALALSEAACDLGARLGELEINPLIVLAKGQGARAVDALVALRATDENQPA